MNLPLLRELVEAHAPSGREDEARAIVRRELEPYGPVETDPLGSVFVRKEGTGGKRVMIAAHLDEIGFMVRFIEDDGFLRVAPLGGWDPRVLNAQRVQVQTRESRLPGLLMPGQKPTHLLTDDEKGKPQKLEDFFVDLGLSKDDVKAQVRIGDTVTMDRPLVNTGPLLTSKAMDDRVGVYVMLEAIRAVGDHSAEIIPVGTSQEEVGLRGAAAAGAALQPDVVIALDITLANDIPGVPPSEAITKVGEGAAIKVMDSSLICHPRLVDHFRAIAEREGIPHQMELLTRGGTDAGAVQRLHGGVPSFTLSIPTRYVHTPNETVHPDDVQACVDLLAAYLREAGDADYAF